MTEFVDVPAFLQVEPEFRDWTSGDHPDHLRRARVVRVTQTRSHRPKPGSLQVKVTLRIPKAAFLPLSPEAVVIIPADFTDPNPIEVVATDAHDDDNPEE